MRLSLLLAILPSVLGAPKAKRDAPAPLYMVEDASVAIADKYIVKFKEGSSIASAGGRISILAESADYVYTGGALDGFAGSLDADTLDELRANPDVEYIEQDATVTLSKIITQKAPPWGLARISDRELGMNMYSYDESAGQGTCVYVIDTGIDDTHPDFGGRAHQIKSFIRGETADGYGHGTHCAGIVGSAGFGVAKKATIFGIKVFSDKGATTRSRIIAGMDYTIQDATKRAVQCPNGAFASLSLGGPKSIVVNNAAAKMVKNNIFVAVAAGNGGFNASDISPASEETVCTVGATSSDDSRAYFSNVGSVVDIFAPGDKVLSLAPGGGFAIMSGTSMATPHIAGLAAYLGALEKRIGGGLCDRIQELATRDVLKDIPAGTKNLLAFNNVPLD